MKTFGDWNELEEWLALLDYESFWREIAPFRLALPDREECDERIAEGVDRATVLTVVRGLARLQLIEELELRPRVMVHGLPH